MNDDTASGAVDQHEADDDDRSLPPTAAASIPSIAEEQPAPEPGRVLGAGPLGAAPATGSTEAEAVPTARPPFDRSVRPGLIALVLAVVLLIVAEQLRTPLFVLGCWIAALIAALTAFVSGNRARYRITNHPDRRRGLAGALVAQLGAMVLFVLLIAGSFLAVRSAPLTDTPVFGGSDAIERLRWGYQRFRLVQGNGWHAVAREPGSCWSPDPEDSDVERRDRLDRIEESLRRISCGRTHTHEVLGVYAVDPRADARYDSDAIEAEALARCRADWGADVPKGGAYVLEMPTAPSWDRGDHDVACLLVATAENSIRSD